jgi:hypothetical protein
VRLLRVFVDEPTVVAETPDCQTLIGTNNVAYRLRGAAQKEFETAGMKPGPAEANDVNAKTSLALRYCGATVPVGYAEGRLILHSRGVTLWNEATATQVKAPRQNQTVETAIGDMISEIAAQLVRPAVNAQVLFVLAKQRHPEGPPVVTAPATSTASRTAAAPERVETDVSANDTSEQDRTVDADVLFKEGRQLAKAGKVAEACDKFSESLRLAPAAGTLMNLADCEEQLGKLMSARMCWKELVSSLPPAGDPRRDHAQLRLEQLEARLPGLTIRPARKMPAGTRILLDALPLGRDTVGRSLLVGPGDHVVSVEAPNRAVKTYRVSLQEGEKLDLAVEPGGATPGGAASAPGR